MFQRVLGLAGGGVKHIRGPGHSYHGHGAVVGAEPPVHVIGLPGTELFVLGNAHSELGGQPNEVWVAGPGLAVPDVDKAQSQGAPDGGVGLVDHTGAHGRSTGVDSCLGGDWPIDQYQWRLGVAGHLHIPVVHLRLGDAL